MRGRILGVVIVLSALAPGASSKPFVEPTVSYVNAAGHFELGVPAVGIDEPPTGGGPINHRRFTFNADDCHRDLRVSVLYEPENLTVGTQSVSVSLLYSFEVRLSDGAGQPLANGSLSWTAPGTKAYLLANGGLINADIYLRIGRDVNYTFTVAGWTAFAAECSWQGLLFINEMEQNPIGVDAGNEWVELYNNGFETVNLAGWILQTHHGQTQTYVIPNGTTLAVGQYLVVTFPTQFLDNDSESVSLFGPRGWEVDLTPASNDTANNSSTWQRVPNGSETWAFQASTQNASNG